MEVAEGFGEVSNMVSFEFALDDNIIDIGGDGFVTFEDFCHHPGKGVAGIPQTFCHSTEAVHSKGCGKTCFLLILLVHPDLVVALKTVEEEEELAAGGYTYEGTDLW
jgi:hypothetical protein